LQAEEKAITAQTGGSLEFSAASLYSDDDTSDEGMVFIRPALAERAKRYALRR
jgi:hypothetical protein